MIVNRQYVYRKEAEEGEDLEGADPVVEKDAPEEVGAAAAKEAELIAEATKMGWTPKDQFKGDPAKWRPADEFVERGRNMLPILRQTVQKQAKQLADLQTSMRELGEYHSKTEKRAMEKALTQLRQERADAIAAGDGVAFDKIDGQIEDLKKKTEAKPQQQNEAEDPIFTEWLSRNRWAEDRKLQSIGRAMAEAMVEDGETARGPALLDKVTEEMKRRYPEKFENPRRTAAAAVESGSGPRKGAGKTYADMPAEARAACDRMAKNGYADKPKEQAAFKAEYVKSYFEDQ